MFSHPDNTDTKRKKAGEELDVYLSTSKEWRKPEMEKLYSAVREHALNKRLRYLKQERELMLTRRNNRYTDEDERNRLTQKLKELRRDEARIRSQPDLKLLEDIAEEFDWLEISMQTFDGLISERSCRLMWKNVLHPSINRGHWTKKEDQLLKKLAENRLSEKQGFISWDNLASEIGNGRTAFHCFMRFQQKHNTFLDRRKWTYEEDERLKQLVAQCRINKHFVPWPKVAYYMTNRTKDQCYQRYVYSLQSHLRKGIFTENEDFIIIIGVKLFGRNWAKIAEFLLNRTPIQIHSRFNTFLNSNFQSWTQKEDLKLLKLVQEKGYRVWAEIAKHFDSRTRSQCRNRFHVIYKMFQLQPNTFNLSKMKYRTNGEITLQGRRQKVLYEKLENKVNSFLEQQKTYHGKTQRQKNRQKKKLRNARKSTRGKEILLGTEDVPLESDLSTKAQNVTNDSTLVSNKKATTLHISDEGSDSNFGSEGDDLDIELEDDNMTTEQSPELVLGDSNSSSVDGQLAEYATSSTSNNGAILGYHVTPEGTKIPKQELLEFMRSLKNQLPLKTESWECGAYESVAYRRISVGKKTGSVANKRYSNPMPMKHMSAFVSTNKKGIPITTYKGNIGRPGAVQNTICKQALTDRSLSIYFRPSWPGRVGKPVGTYKMAKSQQDQLRQALAATNFYGKLLQIYPHDLTQCVSMNPLSSSSANSDTYLDPALELYVSTKNQSLFCHGSNADNLSTSSKQSEPQSSISKTYSQQVPMRSPVIANQKHSQLPTNLHSNHSNISCQTPIRTYSRKRNGPCTSNPKINTKRIPISESDEGTSSHKVYKVEKRGGNTPRSKKDFLQFLPSNNQTLVGFRGLLLQLRTLKSLVHPDGTGVRISLDRIVQEGIHHIDLFSDQRESIKPFSKEVISIQRENVAKINKNSTPNCDSWSGGGEIEICGQRKLTPGEADQLLVDRFLSIYFWPAQMSAVRPPPRENIFEPAKGHARANDYTGQPAGFLGTYPEHPTAPGYDGKYGMLGAGRESLAAAEPFDASKLIEAAKIRAATTPQRRIIIVPRKAGDNMPLVEPKKEPGIEESERKEDETQLALQGPNSNRTDITVESTAEISFDRDNANLYSDTTVTDSNEGFQFSDIHRFEGSTSKR